MPRVLIFKETLLPLSETFILAQMHALRAFEPVLAGLERAIPSLPLQREPILLSRHVPALSDARAKLYRRNGIAPLFHRRLKSTKPDLIHAHFGSGGRAAVPLARVLGVPLVVTLHGNDVTVGGQQPGFYRRVFKEAFLFICVSRFIRDRALAAGFPAEKLVVHYIGIDRARFRTGRPPVRTYRTLFVGRLVEKKGCEYLLRAMKQVQRAHPQAELIVIGDGPLRPSLEALAQTLKIACRFAGAQSPDSVRDALAEAHVLCVPSVTAANGDSEGLPTVVAEAQAMGVPVVGTRHGGIPEIITDGVNGLLVPERDERSLAEALAQLLGNDLQWQAMSQAALQRMKQDFDLATQTERLEQLYFKVLRLGTSDRPNLLSPP